MPYRPRRAGRYQRKSQPHANQTLQKPNGVIGPRVRKVGGEHFAIVCVDPAKYRSEWMMADYFGNLLLEPRTLEHQAANFKLAIELVRQMDPPGVACRDMRECLLCQLRYHQRQLAELCGAVRDVQLRYRWLHARSGGQSEAQAGDHARNRVGQ